MEHRVLFPESALRAQVSRLAAEIDSVGVHSYVTIVVLKGAVIFASDLIRAMTTPTEQIYISASSYSAGFEPGENLELEWAIGSEVEGRHVLVIEDIVDTGRTLREIEDRVRSVNPASVSSVALINKTQRRSESYAPTYTGFDITDEFIYGYGLDWDEKYRDLPFVAVVSD